MRLDNELVNRNMFDSRTRAQGAIKDGLIKVNNKVIIKSSFDVDENSVIEIEGEVMPYVSRGGLKLEKAIDVFHIDMTKKVMLDIGSSTGGFTDCALKHGCPNVIACDVGSDQMAKSLRNDSRVELYENTDFRDIDKDVICKVNFATIDVSFISVTKIIDLFHELDNLKEVMCLIKPQFECGKELADKYKGVINDKKAHLDVIKSVVKAFNAEGYYISDISVSPIKGGSGNTEYIALFMRGNKDNLVTSERIEAVVKEAF